MAVMPSADGRAAKGKNKAAEKPEPGRCQHCWARRRHQGAMSSMLIPCGTVSNGDALSMPDWQFASGPPFRR